MKKFLCVCLLAAALSAHAATLAWQPLDSLAPGDRHYAELTLYEMFGDKPDEWPDWIDPAALYVPTAHDRLMIVRRPVHAPCGQYRFAVFGPVTPDGRRDRYGDFCGGRIGVIPVEGLEWPDLLVEEGRIPDAAGVWRRLDQRLRYRDGQWWRILKPEA